MRAGRWLLLLFVLVASVASLAAGQAPAARIFRSAIDLTTVGATVRDRDGQLVRDLPREAFEVFEDGERQKVTQFTNERVAMSIGLLLDTSDSMFGRRIDEARGAVERFVSDLLGRDDEFSILAFNHRQRLLTEWTADRGAAARVLQPLRPWGSTAIYDAIRQTLPLVEVRNRQRGVLIVISDGADTASDVALRELRFELNRSDAFIYAVAVDSADRRAINARVNPSALGEITNQSGGRTLVVHDMADAMDALTDIAEELNSQYLFGYTSPKGADGEYHSIRVRVRDRDYRVRARNGHVAPPPRPQGR